MIMSRLEQLHQEYEQIYIQKPDNELASLLQTAVDCYLAKHPKRNVCIIDEHQSFDKHHQYETGNAVIVCLPNEGAADQPLRPMVPGITHVILDMIG
jgi:hypothetical protein